MEENEDELFARANAYWDAENYSQAYKLFVQAAELRYSWAYNYLGICFEKGMGVRKNIAVALRWYKKAYQAGELHCAINNIGTLYVDAGNFRQARFWLLKAIRHGDGDAALDLAKLYLTLPRGESTARKFLKKTVASKYVTENSREEAALLLTKHMKKQSKSQKKLGWVERSATHRRSIQVS
jgi:TPR repeat protein